MRISLIFLFFGLIFLSISYGQSSALTIKVVELDSSVEISRAIVFIDELHYEDTETDERGIAYFEKVPIGKIILNVRKPGFLPIRESVNVTTNIKLNTALVKLQKIATPKIDAQNTPTLDIDNSFGSIIVGGDNLGIVQGENSFIDNSKTYITSKVEIPKPKIKLLSVDYSDQPDFIPPLKENEKIDTALIKERLVYKSFIRFKYYSEIQRSNIDFRVRSWSIQNVEVECTTGNYTTANIILPETGKIMGKRVYTPENGEYQLTFYNKYPLKDIWKYVQIEMNEIVAEIEK